MNAYITSIAVGALSCTAIALLWVLAAAFMADGRKAKSSELAPILRAAEQDIDDAHALIRQADHADLGYAQAQALHQVRTTMLRQAREAEILARLNASLMQIPMTDTERCQLFARVAEALHQAKKHALGPALISAIVATLIAGINKGVDAREIARLKPHLQSALEQYARGSWQ